MFYLVNPGLDQQELFTITTSLSVLFFPLKELLINSSLKNLKIKLCTNKAFSK